MKSPLHSCLALTFVILAAGASTARSQEPANKGMGVGVLPKVIPATGRDRATDAQVKAMQDASKAGQPVNPDPARNALSIENTSQFIQFDGDTTVVPKGSIVYLPPKQKDHVVDVPGASLVSWTDFTLRHRALVTYLDVTLDQATGEKPLDPDAFRAARATGMIVVALYQKSPISVAPAAIPAKP